MDRVDLVKKSIQKVLLFATMKKTFSDALGLGGAGWRRNTMHYLLKKFVLQIRIS